MRLFDRLRFRAVARDTEQHRVLPPRRAGHLRALHTDRQRRRSHPHFTSDQPGAFVECGGVRWNTLVPGIAATSGGGGRFRWTVVTTDVTIAAVATIYRRLLARGYFPKELPPTFFTEHYAQYSTSQHGRLRIAAFKPANSFTDSATYELALPGGGRRALALPHPWSYARLAQMVSKSFKRLLKKASASNCTRSRPVYSATGDRAVRAATKPSNLGRERAAIRGGARYLVKVDISQFYPSLYTHAVGWAIDPKLRDRANWKNSKLLGRRIDQALMDLQGKISQGIPIGNDISFLLAEVVLGEVDRSLRLDRGWALRWFDDYEIACESLDEAERWLAKLHSAMTPFRLKLNQAKTKIIPLPSPTLDIWQTELSDAARGPITNPQGMLGYFDRAFRLRIEHPEAPVLNYALGMLFRIKKPREEVARIAQSLIAQALLGEPGCAQKGFALLTYWHINGMLIDESLFERTVSRMVIQQRHRGFSSDVSWGLFFCLQQRLKLEKAASDALASCDDNCIVIQALHLKDEGLLPKGFTSKALVAAMKTPNFDGRDWLLLYESHRQHFSGSNTAILATHSFFGDLLAKNVAFYRRKVPRYASVIQSGGAPEWVVMRWFRDLLGMARPPKPGEKAGETTPVQLEIAKDIARLSKVDGTIEQTIAQLLDIDDDEKPGVGTENDAGVTYPV